MSEVYVLVTGGGVEGEVSSYGPPWLARPFRYTDLERIADDSVVVRMVDDSVVVRMVDDILLERL